jgi:hypothetical protein
MATSTWWSLRISRWALWFASIAYYLYFWIDPDRHLDQFGHLTYTTEAFMFGLPLAAVFIGYFELMVRERAGIPRPTFSRVTHPQDWPTPKGDPGARDKF